MATADDDVAERTCIVCREPKDEADLIRFVSSPDHRVVPDLRRKLPGRGVWVSLSRDAVTEACRRKLFAHGLRAACTAELDLPQQVEKLLQRDALALLSLANKAGLVVLGFAKVAEAISANRVRILLAACDGALDGRSKLARHLNASPQRGELAECFNSGQLGLALGRVNVIHAAVAASPLAEKLVAAVRRLETYRGSSRTEVTKGV